jgi:spore germination cell wall hydrolase CwlJ-like protein
MKNGLLTILVIIILGSAAAAVADDRKQCDLTDTQIVAMTILGEARGEGKAGMYAVGCVISQRAINRDTTPAEICLQRKQFSCWQNQFSSNQTPKSTFERMLKTKEGEYAILVAKNIKGLDRGFVKYADHYVTLKTQVYWMNGHRPVIVIGNHKFFKLRRGNKKVTLKSPPARVSTIRLPYSRVETHYVNGILTRVKVTRSVK